jgi:hypothetical protein
MVFFPKKASRAGAITKGRRLTKKPTKMLITVMNIIIFQYGFKNRLNNKLTDLMSFLKGIIKCYKPIFSKIERVVGKGREIRDTD